MTNTIQCRPSYLETISSHADFVFGDEVGTFFLGVIGVGKEHTLVPFGFLIGAYAAWLWLCRCA